MTAPLIELARRDDVPAILAIANQAAQSTAANFATEPELESDWLATYDLTRAYHPWLVARAEGRVIGFARSGPYRARGAYRYTVEVSVYIEPGWHRRGVGHSLYARLIPMLRAQGYATLFAGIVAAPGAGESELNASERLHARAGFRRIGLFHRAGWKFGRWHDVGFWEMQLRPDTEPVEIAPVRAVERMQDA